MNDKDKIIVTKLRPLSNNYTLELIRHRKRKQAERDTFLKNLPIDSRATLGIAND